MGPLGTQPARVGDDSLRTAICLYIFPASTVAEAYLPFMVDDPRVFRKWMAALMALSVASIRSEL